MIIYRNKEYGEVRMYVTIVMVMCCVGSIWVNPHLWLFDVIFFSGIELLFLSQKSFKRIDVSGETVLVLYSIFFQKKKMTFALDKLSAVLTKKMSFRGGKYVELDIINDGKRVLTVDSLSGIDERDIEALYKVLTAGRSKVMAMNK